MKTLKIPYTANNDTKNFIQSLREQQSVVIRLAYNMVFDGLKEKDIRSKLKNYNLGRYLNSWSIQSAIYKAKELNASELSILLKNNSDITKRKRRIFGGRNNLSRRSKLLISKEEYKEKRTYPLYIIGEKQYKGNRLFDFENNKIIFKPIRGIRHDLIIDAKLRKNYKNQWNELVKCVNNNQLAVTISLTGTHMMISFDESHFLKNKFVGKENRYCGIDLNPRNIGLSISKYSNNKHIILTTKLFNLDELLSSRDQNKIKHETIEIAHSIGRMCHQFKVSKVYLEELDFKSANLGNKNVNKDIGSWKRSIFKQILSKYYKISFINAAYSSTIGNIKNSSYPDAIGSSLEIGRRGYDVYVVKSKKFYPELINKELLKKQWKQDIIIPDFKNWKELHDYIKNSKMKYRVSNREGLFFRKYSSHKSKSLVYQI